ncbi:EcsC family protein [Clostridium fermenticellae]|uniref:EcsC family protein n=1 Tax=Clostridium fermenticellae TaxID=2068654 RepID=A0A386H5D5_9CLOT|nr:EcsC family protein [Clostridium fermenticellae]AYD40753.1 EcsC family protein [Clostridium fermenticellae]
MNLYEDKALRELIKWKKEMQAKPDPGNIFAKNIEDKMNSFIPEKVQALVSKAVENMIKAVIDGCKYSSSIKPIYNMCLQEREKLVIEKMKTYRNLASASGAGTGAAGMLIGMADFPVLLSLKMNFLFDAAGIYGFNAKNYKERLYILYVFQIAFSSQKRRNEIYNIISNWESYSNNLPKDKDSFDWRTFQQEYRDYIDIAKTLQLIPGFGAIVGAYANYKLMEKLCKVAMNAYRFRVFKIED